MNKTALHTTAIGATADANDTAATEWLVRRDSGEWTDADQRELDAWLDADLAHRIAFLRVESVWTHAARMQALGAGVPPGVIPPPGSWGDRGFFRQPASPETPAVEQADPPPHMADAPATRAPHRTRRTALVALAATLAAVTAGLSIYQSGYFRGDRYSTDVGGLDTVPIADGSTITLNTDTLLRVSLSAAERHIALDKGEAYFDVANDPARPFIVQVGDKRVIAVGTQFSVRRHDDDIRVAVTEGRVRIEAAPHAGADTATATATASGTAASIPTAPPAPTLTAGAVAHTLHTEVLIHENAANEIEQLLSWRHGYLVFRNTVLADAVAEFNRYSERKIIIEDPTVAGIRIGGNFRSNNADAFLWMLQQGFPVTVEEDSNRIVLRSR